jgi:hypothetical protein
MSFPRVSEGVLREAQPDHPHAHPHEGKTLCMQPLRQAVHDQREHEGPRATPLQVKVSHFTLISIDLILAINVASHSIGRIY